VTTITATTASNVPAHAAKALQKAADGDGDYTAASVAANPESAGGLVRQSDGDYRRMSSAAAQSSTAVQAAVNALKKGG
jgi:hypothetical protein